MRTHGQSNPPTPEYTVWSQMLARCTNPNTREWKYWGGRGITVCDRWRHSFVHFFADMGRKPSAQHSLDRVNNDLGYSAENCRWATPKEQVKNRRVSYSQKLTEAAVLDMRASGASAAVMAEKYGVSIWTVYAVRSHRRHADTSSSK